MQVDFKFSIGDQVVYTSTGTIGTIQGMSIYKNDPNMALIEYVDAVGVVQSFWRNENDFQLVE